MTTPTRRTFLKTAALAAVTTVWTARSWGRVIGANDAVRVAVVGLNGRGRNHLTSLRAVPGVRIAAICDVDTEVLDRVAALLAKDGLQPKKFTDVRELLASPEIDAITVATPNHWHSLMGIWACQAGKDVYVEKPVSHNIWEGRQLVAAAAQYNRVVQAGVQVRSGEGMQEAVAWVQAGQLGKITAARGFCYKRRQSIGRTTGPQPVPASVDYDLWSGPAPLTPTDVAALVDLAPTVVLENVHMPAGADLVEATGATKLDMTNFPGDDLDLGAVVTLNADLLIAGLG